MYIYIMNRTQIYLSDQEAGVLERLARETGKSKSQLIRDAIADAYLGNRSSSDETLNVIRSAAGTWKGRRESGARYVDRIRTGRLTRIHPQGPG